VHLSVSLRVHPEERTAGETLGSPAFVLADDAAVLSVEVEVGLRESADQVLAGVHVPLQVQGVHEVVREQALLEST